MAEMLDHIEASVPSNSFGDLGGTISVSSFSSAGEAGFEAIALLAMPSMLR